MLLRLRNKKAQAHMAEYALIFFITVGFLSTITIYARRALQARIYDAGKSMKTFVGNDVQMVGDVVLQYEPYYVNTITQSDSHVQTNATLETGGQSGLFKKSDMEESSMASKGITLPPREAK